MGITYNQTGVTYDTTAYNYDGEPFAPSVFPVAGVYIAFTDGPYTASPVWTEVTTYVRNISTHRGRSSDFEQFDTGTAQLTLDNRDRRFDPFNTSGPYYTNLVPRRQIRIVGQIGGSTYEVFRGYIAGWPVAWSDAGKDSTVTIQCFDALGLMANETLPTDWPDYYTKSLNPTHYLKYNDSRSATKLVDQYPAGGTDLSATSITQPTFENPPMAPGIVGNSLYVTNANNTFVSNTTTQSDMTLSCYMSNPNVTTTDNTTIYRAYGYTYLYIIWSATGGLSINGFNLGRSRERVYTAPQRSQPFHLVATLTANAGGDPDVALYINNVLQTSTSTTTAANTLPPGQAIAASKGIFQEISTYDRILNTTEIALLYNALTGRFSETSSARMNRLAGTTSFPAALESFTSNPVATVSEIGSGAGVIAEMQLVADSEGGEIYVSKTGVLTTTSRFDVFNATRSANVQATITDSGTGLRYGPELLIEYDADELKNDVTVQFSGDGEVSASSSAVIAGYGGASTTIETQLDSPTSAAQLALLELGVEGSLVPRISPIDLSPNTAAADWQTILGLELLDRVTFKRTPTTGNQFNRDALINAIDHQIEPGVWRTQVQLSMRYTSPLTLDDDVLGTLDFNYLG